MTLAAVLLALSSSAAGEETTHEPYRVLRTRNAETLQRDLRRVAAEGYRACAAMPLTVATRFGIRSARR